MRELWYFMLLESITITAVLGQAPGDETDICLTRITRQSFANQILLMSSHNYNNLIEDDGPWIVRNEDDNNDGGTLTSDTTWTESGSSCERVTSVCGFTFGTQDNWLITQFINNTLRRREIYIKVVFTLNSDCAEGITCKTTLDMFVLQTNVSNQSFVEDVTVFGRDTSFVLTSNIRDGSTLINRVFRITADLATTGLYVAIRDTGTCAGVSEVTVFYPVCDSVSLDFGANFTGTRFPDENTSGRCFNNMAISLDAPDEPFNATCRLDMVRDNSLTLVDVVTSWTIDGGPSGCMCLPGYEFTGRTSTSQCQACQPFTFKNTLSNDNMCQPCPIFSNTSGVATATAVCPCDSGYFRPLDGSEDTMACTRPPSPPRNIMYSDVTNTSVFIMWEASIDNGNRADLIYTITQNVTDDIITTANINITLMGLLPFVSYEIRVTADNGVSSQDDNEEGRTLSISVMMLEGVGGVIDESTFQDDGVILTWEPPVFPQGTILYYEVAANRSSSNFYRTYRTESNEFNANFNDLVPGMYYIEVRAVTSVGPGEYSDCHPFKVMTPSVNCTASDGTSVAVGETFMDQCNTCNCVGGGIATCTLRACIGCTLTNGSWIEVGNTYKMDCNTCTCSSNETETCTNMDCQEMQGPDGAATSVLAGVITTILCSLFSTFF